MALEGCDVEERRAAPPINPGAFSLFFSSASEGLERRLSLLSRDLNPLEEFGEVGDIGDVGSDESCSAVC